MWGKSKRTTEYDKITVTYDIRIAQCENKTIKYEKKVREPPNVTKELSYVMLDCTMWEWNHQMWEKSKGTIEYDKKTVTCEDGTAKCEEKVREPPNMTKELSHVTLELHNKRMKPSNVRKKIREPPIVTK